MNKHLTSFFKDEIKNNDYFEYIRMYADGRDYARTVQAIVDCYYTWDDFCGPFRYLDLIEDYLREQYREHNDISTERISRVISAALE